MSSIPQNYGPELHHLRVLDVLLREHGLTRAARELNVSQPALSKTLAHLRRHFDDPLFVRVGLRMEPTPKALQLQAPVRAILERMQSLRSEHVAFDPRSSHRTFNFSVVDAGLIKLLPPLVERLLTEAPNVRLNVLQLEAAHLEPWLESGKLDFAMGSFPMLTKGIRRQLLWAERYVGGGAAGHPRISSDPAMRAFAAEKHVLVSIAGSGHAHQTMERALEGRDPGGEHSSAAFRRSSARRCSPSTAMRLRCCRTRLRPCSRRTSTCRSSTRRSGTILVDLVEKIPCFDLACCILVAFVPMIPGVRHVPTCSHYLIGERLMSVRKRSWMSRTGKQEAWVVDYADQNGQPPVAHVQTQR